MSGYNGPRTGLFRNAGGTTVEVDPATATSPVTASRPKRRATPPRPSGTRSSVGTGLFPKLNNGPSPQGVVDVAERERVLDQALAAGKFSRERRAHYAALFDRDPAGTKALIGRLAAGAVPQPVDRQPERRGTGLFGTRADGRATGGGTRR